MNNLTINDIPLYIIKTDKSGLILETNIHIHSDAKFKYILEYENIFDIINFEGINTKKEFDSNIIDYSYIINLNHNKLDLLINVKKVNEEYIVFLESNYKCYEIKNTFMQNLSHEIRSPLNGIIGVTSLLQDTVMNTEQINYLEMLKESSNNLINIVDNILDYSKLELGKLKLHKGSFYLHEIINSVHTIMSSLANEKTIKMSYEIDPDIPEFIVGDSLRIQQILINLYTNSLKFSNPKGEIITKIKLTGDKEINSKYLQENEFYIYFTVQDTGSQHHVINENVNFKLFKSYSQLFNKFDQRNNEGTGLGLAICKELTLLMDGDIWLESSSKETGTKFGFCILSEKSYEEGAPIDLVLLKNKSILIVDHNITNRVTLSSILTKYGIIPFPVSTSDEALIYIKNNIHFDLALLDIYLPRFTGVKLAEHIKILKPDLTLIALSSLGDKINKIGTNLFNHLLVKPVNENKLLSIIQATLIKKELRESNLQIKIYENVKILIDEDDPFNRKIIRKQLEKLGYSNITEVQDGKECIETLQVNSFSIVFIDIKTPFLTGYQVMEYINNNVNPKPYTICLSGLEIQKGIFDETILKPIQINKLKSLMENFHANKN